MVKTQQVNLIYGKSFANGTLKYCDENRNGCRQIYVIANKRNLSLVRIFKCTYGTSISCRDF